MHSIRAAHDLHVWSPSVFLKPVRASSCPWLEVQSSFLTNIPSVEYRSRETIQKLNLTSISEFDFRTPVSRRVPTGQTPHDLERLLPQSPTATQVCCPSYHFYRPIVVYTNYDINVPRQSHFGYDQWCPDWTFAQHCRACSRMDQLHPIVLDAVTESHKRARDHTSNGRLANFSSGDYILVACEAFFQGEKLCQG